MKGKRSHLKCNLFPKIYKQIGIVALVTFAIYIIIKTVKTQNRKKIEGFKEGRRDIVKRDDNNNSDNSDNNNDDNSNTRNSSSNNSNSNSSSNNSNTGNNDNNNNNNNSTSSSSDISSKGDVIITIKK
jgi:hypothetical protein